MIQKPTAPSAMNPKKTALTSWFVGLSDQKSRPRAAAMHRETTPPMPTIPRTSAAARLKVPSLPPG